MNIPDFAKVLTAIIHHNVDLARQGGTPRDYLVPMAWGDPGLGKTEIVETVADDLHDVGRDLVDPAEDTGCWEVAYADMQTRDPAVSAACPGCKTAALSVAGRTGCPRGAVESCSSTSSRPAALLT